MRAGGDESFKREEGSWVVAVREGSCRGDELR